MSTPGSRCGVVLGSGRGASSTSRALFLDRDGVINVNHGYVHTPEKTDWVPGIFELCAAAQAADYMLVIVTNQAGIARGLYTEAQFRAYTRWVHQQFYDRRIRIAATYYCPHHPEIGIGRYHGACDCRKPGPGMIQRAAAELGIAPDVSIMLGDSATDVLAGDAAGIGLAMLSNWAHGSYPLSRLLRIF